MNKSSKSKNLLNPKAPFKWGFMNIIPSTALKSLTSEKIFSSYLSIFDAYSKIPKLYGMEKVSRQICNDRSIWMAEPIIDPDPFFTSCHIYSMNKKARSKNPLNPKAYFKWVFIDIILATAPIFLTSDTTLSN